MNATSAARQIDTAAIAPRKPAGSAAAVIQAWLRIQCRMIPNARQAVVLLDEDARAEAPPTACWSPEPVDSQALTELQQIAREAFAANRAISRDLPPVTLAAGQRDTVTAVPLTLGPGPQGVIAIRCRAVPPAQQQTIQRLLNWGKLWLKLLLSQAKVNPERRDEGVEDLLALLLRQDGAEAAATTLTLRLARRLDCARASLGWVEDGEVHLAAMSSNARFDRRTNLARTIEAAMQEALHRGATVDYDAEAAAASLPAHATLAQSQNAGAVCSLLLGDGQGPQAVLTLEQGAGRRFERPALQWCETACALAGPVLALRRRVERPLHRQIRQRCRDALGGLLGRRHLRAKGLAALAAAVLVYASLGTAELRIAAPAALEGRVQRAVVAPYAGFVAEAYARAGDLVDSGQALARLDDAELQLRRRHWLSQREELSKQQRRALAELDGAEARIIGAQIAQTDVQIRLLDEQLSRTNLQAPIAGVLISGDLSRALGTPVERGQVLFEVAPLDDYRVALQVDERDIAEVHVGQHGSLTLSALPGQRYDLTVTGVSAVERGAEDAASFRVEAQLHGAPEALRPGMQGLAKLAAGEHRLLWVWARRMVGWMQLQLWSRLP